MKHGALDSCPLLPDIILQQEDGMGMQLDDGKEVAQRDATHKEVAKVPYQIETGQSAEDHHDNTVHHTHENQPTPIVSEKFYVHLAIGIVADDRRKGKHEDGYGDKRGASRADLILQSRLSELNAIETIVGIHATEQDDKGGATANEQPCR